MFAAKNFFLAGGASGLSAVDYLVVAGGGGGGGGGAGGAGGFKTATSFAVTAGISYTVTVGAGGAAYAASVQGSDGSNSVFSSITSTGGGGGGGSGAPRDGRTGGSGGGAGANLAAAGTGGAGTSGQGNAGGNGFTNGTFANQLPSKMFYTLDTDFLIDIDGNTMKFLVEKQNTSGEYTALKTSGLDVHVMNKYSLLRCVNNE